MNKEGFLWESSRSLGLSAAQPARRVFEGAGMEGLLGQCVKSLSPELPIHSHRDKIQPQIPSILFELCSREARHDALPATTLISELTKVLKAKSHFHASSKKKGR